LILKRDPGRLRLSQGASLKSDKSKGLRIGSCNQGYPLLTWLRPTFDNMPVTYIPVSLEPCEPRSSYIDISISKRASSGRTNQLNHGPFDNSSGLTLQINTRHRLMLSPHPTETACFCAVHLCACTATRTGRHAPGDAEGRGGGRRGARGYSYG
jgi:hypothetical protein